VNALIVGDVELLFQTLTITHVRHRSCVPSEDRTVSFLYLWGRPRFGRVFNGVVR
jgi:hypothetical protein